MHKEASVQEVHKEASVQEAKKEASVQEAAKKASAAAEAQQPDAALGAAGAADAAALARPTNTDGNDEDAPAGDDDDTAAKREANRTVEANAAIIVEPDNSVELRNKLLSSTAGRAMGQHGCGKCPH